MTQEPQKLLQFWNEALALKKAGRIQEALALFEALLKAQPDWEHGYGQFNLAECYEADGRIREAETAHKKAVKSSPHDLTLRGGLASFLYLHGPAEEAFDEHVCLYRLEQQSQSAGAAETMTALQALGARLGWSSEKIAAKINHQK